MEPMEIIQMIKSGQNPQQIVLKMLENQIGNTPIGANLLDLAKNNNTKEIERIARNLIGANYDKEFTSFKKSFGL